MSGRAFLGGRVRLFAGDMLAILPTLPENSVDSVVCDPPYHLTSIVNRFGAEGAAAAKVGATGAFARASSGFMGKTWDGGDIAFRSETWAAVLRVLKPGGYILAFSSSRTFGRMSVAMEDAGFITHPMIGWLFGQGFPKATRIKAEGYDGFRYGAQALKPALEPIFCGSKPFSVCPPEDDVVNFQAHLEALLWSLASVKTVEAILQRNPAGRGGSVRWIAFIQAKIASDDLREVMATFSSPEVALTFLSIASLWSAISADGFSGKSTFTTEMVSRATTDLRTLRSWISAIIPESIIQAATLQNGVWFHAPDVASKSHDWLACWASIPKPSVAESVTGRSAKGILCELARIAERHSLLSATQIENIVRDPARTKAEQNSVALEPIYMGQKPFSEATGTANILRHGTGALNIDGCRVPAGDGVPVFSSRGEARSVVLGDGLNGSNRTGESGASRWPANLIHDGSDEVVAGFPDAPGQQRAVGPEHGAKPGINVYGDFGARDLCEPRGDAGSVARFFYAAKADSEDRVGSRHPTVKPLDLMQYLVRLATPPGGLVLDPFAGTGTTGEAAIREGMRAILIEMEAESQADIARRMELAAAGPAERKRVIAQARKKAGPHAPLFDAAPSIEAAE